MQEVYRATQRFTADVVTARATAACQIPHLLWSLFSIVIGMTRGFSWRVPLAVAELLLCLVALSACDLSKSSTVAVIAPPPPASPPPASPPTTTPLASQAVTPPFPAPPPPIFYSSATPQEVYNNMELFARVPTTADEQAEFTLWQRKVAAANITLGVKYRRPGR